MVDNFRSAEIVSESNKFDATQYSFFGEPSAGSGLELQGGLEDGFDAPLEESENGAALYHLAPRVDVEEEDDEDLSLAAIFASQIALEDSPSAAEAPQPFLLGNDVITTPERMRRPSSPSLRLTPGAPSSIHQDNTPAHTLRGVPDLSMLEAVQLRQAAAFTPPSAHNPMQLLQLLSHQGTPAAQSAGRVTGPTSAADLEAQMLAQAQGQTPGLKLWMGLQPDSGMQHHLDNPMSLGVDGMPQHGMQQQQYVPGAWGDDAPYQNPGFMADDQGMPFTSPMQLPGKGVLSPFPGQMPDLEHSTGKGAMPHAQPRSSPFPLPPSHHEQRSSFPTPPPPPPFYMSPAPPPRSMPHHPPHPSPPMSLPQGHTPGAPPHHTQLRYDAGPPPYPPYPGSLGHYQQQQPGAPPPQGYMQQQQRSFPYPVRPQQMQLQRQPGQSPYQQPHQHQHQRNASPGRGRNLNPSPRRLRGGSLMSEDEVDHIMRIMYAAVHAGHPYTEDYYFQAFTNLHCSGCNDAAFEPAALRDLAEGVVALDSSAAAKFVPLEGLGKIVYSNLRTPRMLLDFGSGGDRDEAAGDGGRAVRPLDQEPLLAARIMIEDCVNLLLDVDDIDRCIKAAVARAVNAPGPGSTPLPGDAADLLQRRALLLAGIASSFRLPRRPGGADPAPAAAAPPTLGGPDHKLSDLVFRRIMALPKGRKLLARTLLVISPPLLPAAPAVAVPSVANMDPLQLLWAALRNAGWLFGSSFRGLEAGAERALAEATTKVAAASVQALRKVRERSALVGCLEALSGGLRQGGGAAGPGCLPLIRTRRSADELAGAEWLGDVVMRVMGRAEELGLGGASAGEASGEQQQWEGLVAGVVEAVAGHLQALGAVHAAASAAGSAEALAMVAAQAAKPVVQAVSQQAADEGRSRLRTLALALVG